jgi:hypothetical protein
MDLHDLYGCWRNKSSLLQKETELIFFTSSPSNGCPRSIVANRYDDIISYRHAVVFTVHIRLSHETFPCRSIEIQYLSITAHRQTSFWSFPRIFIIRTIPPLTIRKFSLFVDAAACWLFHQCGKCMPDLFMLCPLLFARAGVGFISIVCETTPYIVGAM